MLLLLNGKRREATRNERKKKNRRSGGQRDAPEDAATPCRTQPENIKHGKSNLNNTNGVVLVDRNAMQHELARPSISSVRGAIASSSPA